MARRAGTPRRVYTGRFRTGRAIMLTLQYPLTLPADYDMSIIRRRIATRHAPFDRMAGLGCKAFLIRERSTGAHVNEYAPFYVWTQLSAVRDFLLGAGFDGVVQSFGRP